MKDIKCFPENETLNKFSKLTTFFSFYIQLIQSETNKIKISLRNVSVHLLLRILCRNKRKKKLLPNSCYLKFEN